MICAGSVTAIPKKLAFARKYYTLEHKGTCVTRATWYKPGTSRAKNTAARKVPFIGILRAQTYSGTRYQQGSRDAIQVILRSILEGSTSPKESWVPGTCHPYANMSEDMSSKAKYALSRVYGRVFHTKT